MKAAAQKLGVQAVFFVPQKEDVAAQISTMETYIAQKVVGIAIAPSDPKALAPAIKKGRGAGIPVITLDTDAPESERIAYGQVHIHQDPLRGLSAGWGHD